VLLRTATGGAKFLSM